jgi:hypothetical protein
LDFLKMKETAYDKMNRTRHRSSYHVQFADARVTPDAEISSAVAFLSPKQQRFCADDNLSVQDYAGSVFSPPDTAATSISECEDTSFQCRQSLDSSSDIYDEPSDLTTYSGESDSRLFGCSEEGIEEEGEEVFSVDLDTDLDIEQIEKH